MSKKVKKGWIYPCEYGFDHVGRLTGNSYQSMEMFKLKRSLVEYWGKECPICRNDNCKPVKVKVTIEVKDV